MIRDMGCHGLALFGNLANVFLLLVIPPSSDYAMDVNSFMTSSSEFFLHLAVIWSVVVVLGLRHRSRTTSWKQNPPENKCGRAFFKTSTDHDSVTFL
jgi:hypothetical protein